MNGAHAHEDRAESNPGYRASHRSTRRGPLGTVLAIIASDRHTRESENYLATWDIQPGLSVAVDASLAIVVLAEDPRCTVEDAGELAQVLQLAVEFRGQVEKQTVGRLIS